MKLSLQQKLALTQRPNYLTFFNDKLFLKAYNESAYLVRQMLHKKSPPLVFKMDHKPFQLVVMQSVPKVALLRIIPGLRKTEFGYELSGSYDLTSFSEWMIANEVYCVKAQ